MLAAAAIDRLPLPVLDALHRTYSRLRPGHKVPKVASDRFQDRVVPLRLSADRQYAPLFGAVERLSSLVMSNFPHQERLAEKDLRFIVWTIAIRSLKTVDASVLLADAGYGGQAMTLARGVFEDAVIAWWCSLQEPESLLELVSDHDKSVAMHLQLDRPGRKYFPMVAQRLSFDEQMIQKMTEDLGTNHRVAKNLWTRQSIKGMVDRVLPEMRDVDQQRLVALYDVGYLLSSLFVHQSPASLGTAIQPQFPDAAVLSRKPSTTLVREALSMAYFSVALIARLVALGAQGERLDRILAEDGPLFEYLSPDASDKAERNDVCPCGSGRKFKRCHGRLS